MRNIETITVSEMKGSGVRITDNNLPELNVGRIYPSCILLNNDRYLYVFFGKSKFGRGDRY